jgi:hypothetical protein
MLYARALAVIASAFVMLADSGFAQTPPSDAAKAMLGTWELSNADRDKICMITFRPDPAPPGLKLEFDKACAGVFALTKDVTAWTLGVNDTLRFVDTKGKTILELSEVEARMYEGERPGEGLYFMQNSAPAEVGLRTAEEMPGDWGVMHDSEKPICIVTLLKTAAGDAFTLKVKPGCDPFVSSFNPLSWRMDRGALVLLSARGEDWRFEEDDAVTWHRVPESTDPIVLVRQ